VVGRFDGGKITTDAGGLLLREGERRGPIIARFGECFRDHRAARWRTASKNSRYFFSDRTSTAFLRSNQVRLYSSSVAYTLLTVRRVWVSMAGGYPDADLFAQVHARLRAVPLRC
jgi:hypothetical protein